MSEKPYRIRIVVDFQKGKFCVGFGDEQISACSIRKRFADPLDAYDYAESVVVCLKALRAKYFPNDNKSIELYTTEAFRAAKVSLKGQEAAKL